MYDPDSATKNSAPHVVHGSTGEGDVDRVIELPVSGAFAAHVLLAVQRPALPLTRGDVARVCDLPCKLRRRSAK